MSTARLRKAFRYPDDDDSDEDMDEEHQERLISQLEKEDAYKSSFYRQAFLVVPLASVTIFLYTFVVEARTARLRMFCLLAISSLACTAYILHFMPIGATKSRTGLAQISPEASRGPVERYLLLLNGALATILALPMILTASQHVEAWKNGLPLIVFLLAMFVRYQLAPLDLTELRNASFNLKGA